MFLFGCSHCSETNITSCNFVHKINRHVVAFFDFSIYRSSVFSEWIGFLDPESGIKNFELCVGKMEHACDILNYTNVLLATSYIRSDLSLPVNTDMFVTVKAINHLGLSISATSSPFRVDDSPPVVKQPPTIAGGMTGPVILHDPSYIKIDWTFEDYESPIDHHVLWLRSHHDGHTAIENLQLGVENGITIQLKPEDWLKSGDSYHVIITACNKAGLCTSETSSSILVDSTPPLLGGFKPPMTWSCTNSSCSISLTWYGFSDGESELDLFYVGIGRSYSGMELSGGWIKVNANSSIEEQSHMFPLLSEIHAGEKPILSIYSINAANLSSALGKATVEAVSKDLSGTHGELVIQKHSCDVHYCNNDCTCAIVNRKCSMVQHNMTCTETDAFIKSTKIEIQANYENAHSKVTLSSSCIRAMWTSIINVERFEWSISEWSSSDIEIGAGIFDKLKEPIWYDISQRTNLLFCLPDGKSFKHGYKYVVSIRTWLSPLIYQIFHSNPVLIDLTPPTVRKGSSIRDSLGDCSEDVEFTKITNTITGCWDKVFRDHQSDIIKYYVSVGTSPGGK